jgi:hypothetical protein
MAADIQIRAGRDDERPLVFQSFIREYRRSPYAKDVPAEVLMVMLTRLLEAWGFTVAVEPDADEVLGFIVAQAPNRVGWLQVKRPYRRNGVARALITATGIERGDVLTPFFLPGKTDSGTRIDRLASSHGYEIRFRPWMALHV